MKHSGLPFMPVVEWLNEAPPGLVGAGGALVLFSAFGVMVGAGGGVATDHPGYETVNSIFIYITIGSFLTLLVGMVCIVLGLRSIEREEKRRAQEICRPKPQTER